MICGDCGIEITQADPVFWETCSSCHQPICLNCIRVTGFSYYICSECEANELFEQPAQKHSNT